MKTSVLLLSSLLLLAACQKETKITPKTSPGSINSSNTDTVTNKTVAVSADTLPANANFRVKLVQTTNASNYDETEFVFNKTSSTKYIFDEDAAYLVGFGQVSLASISSDGRDLAINGLPYTPGMSVAIDVNTKTSAALSFSIDYSNKMPSNAEVWLKDNKLKDSVNLCSSTYNFNVTLADTTSFGKNRFKVVIKEGSQPVTTQTNGGGPH